MVNDEEDVCRIKYFFICIFYIYGGRRQTFLCCVLREFILWG